MQWNAIDTELTLECSVIWIDLFDHSSSLLTPFSRFGQSWPLLTRPRMGLKKLQKASYLKWNFKTQDIININNLMQYALILFNIYSLNSHGPVRNSLKKCHWLVLYFFTCIMCCHTEYEIYRLQTLYKAVQNRCMFYKYQVGVSNA